VAALALPAVAVDAPTSGFRAELLGDLDALEKKIVGLAEAIPEEKYSWRPAEGVRTVSEAIMHVAGANFFFPTLVGTKVPEGVNPRELEKITDKAKVIETLKQSYAHLKTTITELPDARLDEAMKLFGRDSSVRGALYVAATHNHEHLGQLIAYGRSVGVKPPWSEG
jgi:uncharacterized damage-inducible protein DinB